MNRNKKVNRKRTENQNRKIGRAMAVMTAGIMLVQPFGAFAAEDGAVSGQSKEETVYVKTDASGSPQEVIVSDWLKNEDGAATLEDYSDLKDIENVKGEETFTQNGNKMIWDAKGSDIYYQGTATKELPVSVKVTYYLDGKEITPENLAGKSGHVKICYTYENRLKAGEVYTPFVMVTGIVLPTEGFLNVNVKNGKLISDGEKDIVVGIGLPGLSESLKLDEMEALQDMEIPESFEVEADVTDFELTLAMTVATPLNLDELNLEDIDSMDELKSSIDELVDASAQLVDGSGALADGIQTLKDSCVELAEGMELVDENMGTLAEGIGTLNSKKGELLEGVGALADRLESLEKNKGALVKGISDLADGSNTLKAGAKKINAGNSQIAQSSQLLQAGAEELAYGSGSTQLKAGAVNLAAGSVDLKNGVAQYTAGAESMAAGTTGYIDSVGAYVQAVNRTFTAILQNQSTADQGSDSSKAVPAAETKKVSVTTIDEDAVADMQSVLGKLQEVRSEISSADSKEDLLRLYASYDSYMAELDECISLMNGALDGVKEETIETETAVSRENADSSDGSVRSGSQEAMAASIKQLMEAGSSLTPEGNENVKQLQSGAGALVAGADEDNTVGDALNAGAVSVAAGTEALNGGMTQFLGGAGALAQNLGKFTSAADELSKGSDTLYKGAEGLSEGADKLKSGAGAISGGIGQLAAGGSKLKSGAGELGSGVEALSNGSMLLKDGTAALAAGGSRLNGGVSELKSGADKLSDGMKEFDEKGVKKITDFLNDEVESMVDRLKAVKDAGEAYKFFSNSGTEMDGSVKFVIETGSIE